MAASLKILKTKPQMYSQLSLPVFKMVYRKTGEYNDWQQIRASKKSGFRFQNKIKG